MPEGTTICDAAKSIGIDIPVLCHDERYDPVGVCRVCAVDVGARVYAAACVRPCEDGMEVKTATPEVEQRRATLTQLLMADQPPTDEDPKETTTADNELLALARRYGVEREDGIPLGSGRGDRPVEPRDRGEPRRLHPLRPLRPRLRRHPGQRRDRPLRQGLLHADRVRPERPDGRVVVRDLRRVRGGVPDGRAHQQADQRRPDQARAELDQVDTVCPYCGVGCALTYHVDRERNAISFAEGREQPGSQRRLCVKGRYGWDYASSPQRLTTPLIRREESYPKGPLSGDVRGEGRGRRQARRARGLRRGPPPLPRGELGRGARPGGRRLDGDPRRRRPGRDRGLRLGQVLERGGLPLPEADPRGFGTNNVDHCTRLCHASSVAALFEGVGSGAVSTTYGDIINADVAILGGTNTTANHPVASSFFKQAGGAARR